MAEERRLRHLLQDTVTAAQAFEQDNISLRERLARYEAAAASRKARSGHGSHGSHARTKLNERDAAPMYDDGHSQMARELLRMLRDVLPQTVGAEQFNEVKMRVRLLSSTIDSWQKKCADAWHETDSMKKEVEASTRKTAEDQAADVSRLRAGGWVNISGGDSAVDELQKYIALFEQDKLPELDTKTDKAWVIDKYSQLRFRHRELFVRCELVQRENDHARAEKDAMERKLAAAEERSILRENEADAAKQRGRAWEEELFVVKAKEAAEARTSGVVLDHSDASLYAWTTSEFSKMRASLAELSALKPQLETTQQLLEQEREDVRSCRGQLHKLDEQLNAMQLQLQSERAAREGLVQTTEEYQQHVDQLNSDITSCYQRVVSHGTDALLKHGTDALPASADTGDILRWIVEMVVRANGATKQLEDQIRSERETQKEAVTSANEEGSELRQLLPSG